MSSPLEDKAARIRSDEQLPIARDWIINREQSLLDHWQSIENIGNALLQLGRTVLRGRIDSDLWVRASNPANITDPKNNEPVKYNFNVVPTVAVMRVDPLDTGFMGHGELDDVFRIWHPNVALRAAVSLDETSWTGESKAKQPTGDLRLRACFTTWGNEIKDEDRQAVQAVPDCSIKRSDVGWYRYGTHIFVERGREDVLTQGDAETILAALGEHILGHADIHNRPPLNPRYEIPEGNFSSSRGTVIEPVLDLALPAPRR